jgi:hypothetical protein
MALSVQPGTILQTKALHQIPPFMPQGLAAITQRALHHAAAAAHIQSEQVGLSAARVVAAEHHTTRLEDSQKVLPEQGFTSRDHPPHPAVPSTPAPLGWLHLNAVRPGVMTGLGMLLSVEAGTPSSRTLIQQGVSLRIQVTDQGSPQQLTLTPSDARPPFKPIRPTVKGRAMSFSRYATTAGKGRWRCWVGLQHGVPP